MRTTSFRDLVEVNPKVSLKKGEPYPFVEMAIVEPSNRYVRTENERAFKGGGSRFLVDDTIFARITPCLENGKIGQYKGSKSKAAFGSTEFFVFRAREDVSDSGYVFYLCKSDLVQGPAIKSMSGASGRQRASIDSILDVQVPAHTLSTQRKIAAILSAYDDLIENNLRRIKILEEMAQNLYREWFVKFRFPGYEKVKFVDSPIGMIPEGWEVLPFTEIADVLSGGTPKTNITDYWNGTIPFFAPKDAPASFFITETEKQITEIGLSKCNSKLYPARTVFITARGTVGKIAMPSKPMAMNQSCYALRGRNGISQTYLFLSVITRIEYLKKNTGGATFDTIVVDTFRRMMTTRPSQSLVETFSSKVEPLFDSLLNLTKRIDILRKSRDLLLPKLIAGDIDVSVLDIRIPQEVLE